MNATMHATVWSRYGEDDRLDPHSPLAQDVLNVNCLPAHDGWTLDNVYVSPVRRAKPNAFERARTLALTGRHI